MEGDITDDGYRCSACGAIVARKATNDAWTLLTLSGPIN